MTEETHRLSKLMSERGLASRRESDRLIERGLVRVNGKVIDELGFKTTADAIIELLPQAKKALNGYVTILVNKPVGYVSNLPEKDYIPAIELITPENIYPPEDARFFNPYHRQRLAVAGRLDIDSRGLMVMTQDGVVAKQLIGENTEIEKEYLVFVEGRITQEILQRLSFGLSLDGKPLKPAKVSQPEPQQLRFILREGKKRQIRRMCELVDLRVHSLKRVRIGRIALGDLPEGCWRYLKPHESF